MTIHSTITRAGLLFIVITLGATAAGEASDQRYSTCPIDGLWDAQPQFSSNSCDLGCDEVGRREWSLFGNSGLSAFGADRGPVPGCNMGPHFGSCGPACSGHHFGIRQLLNRHKEHSQEKRLRLYLEWQNHKKLLHPECPPVCHGSYGFYQTSWRPAPECDTCPQGDAYHQTEHYGPAIPPQDHFIAPPSATTLTPMPAFPATN